MARILLLEDDPFLGKGLMVQLNAAGHDVDWCSTVAHAKQASSANAFDLLILDVNLPDGSGMDFCRQERAMGRKNPIIMLTARTDDDSVVSGFECGANDYVKKPFSNRELLARLQSLLREPFVKDEKIRVGPIVIFVAQRKVEVDGAEIPLNRREFDIFVHLAQAPGIVLSREQLLQNLNSGGDIMDRTIDSHFSHIRAKLKKFGVSSVAIRSVYGVGYTLEIS